MKKITFKYSELFTILKQATQFLNGSRVKKVEYQGYNKGTKTMRIFNAKTYIFSALLLGANPLFAGEKTEAGLTLLETPGARAAALGGAFSAMTDDVTAFSYNPAALDTLTSGDASFLYQQGIADDSFGQLFLGMPTSKASVGVSLGYYDGGDVEVFNGVSQRTVTAQKDLTLGIGLARTFGPVSLGLTGKYISSEIGDANKATAFAGDLGLFASVHERINVSAALQNFGTALQYDVKDNDLPQIARVGASFLVISEKAPTTILLEAPYHLNTSEVNPAIGVESLIGPLALRAGYQSGSDLEGFTAGAGFKISQLRLDYSFGLVDELDTRHRISIGYRFGPASSEKSFSRKPNTEKNLLASAPEKQYSEKAVHSQSLSSRPVKQWTPGTGRTYTVRPGDTLAKISQRVYGTTDNWQMIYNANKHIVQNPNDLAANQRLVLP